ncbi:hypothetical protein A2Z23_01035 [Candidatus Curtissbacteria bacterium RBG_16_39_7]|uniref:Uncharacterized protein n=1 Tax=Candidatus Curtissbacteria bacterium RBG_16_39_7 TaxID=1797707 RepID=A0A1F5G344_9BACT|nr:MAG: hypothetical protein A2Z23_01035 [Candidatus Curtissbacteria bacterium RBG_16_39_7]
MHRALLGLISLLLAYVLSYLYIGLIAALYEELSGEILGVGALALFYPMIFSTVVFFYLLYNLISEIRGQSINSSKSIRIKTWIIKIIIGFSIIGTLTSLVLVL